MPNTERSPRIPTPSSPEARARMKSVRQSGTAAEQRLGSELKALGLRFLTDVQPVRTIRRRGDFVFKKVRLVIFVDGCFWHSCPSHATSPKANAEWWSKKLAANVARDRDTDRVLRREGWTVVRVWEHEDMGPRARRIKRMIDRRLDGWFL
jgi:DNA mismatch endonuclease, patch repair protein